jgi:hypothetical protein
MFHTGDWNAVPDVGEVMTKLIQNAIARWQRAARHMEAS